MSVWGSTRRYWLRHLNPWKSPRRHLATTCKSLNILRSEVPDLDLPTGNSFATVFRDTSKWSDKIATECNITGRSYNYGSLLDKTTRWGGMLSKLGVSKGDVIALALTNCPEYPIALFGALSIGASVTTISSSFTAEEICRQLTDCNACLVVGDPLIEKTIQEALTLYKKPTHLVINGASSISSAINLQHILDDPTIPYADPVQLSGNEVAILPYSSGTTGPPKGVAISHNAINAHMINFTHPLTFGHKETTADQQDASLCVLPFYHMYGMMPIMAIGLFKGLKLVCIPKFNPDTYVDTIYKHKIATLHLVPPMMNFLINSPTATAERLASLDVLFCGAAPVPPSGAKAIIEKLGRPINFQEGFGMTETIITALVPRGADRLGTIGKVLPNILAKVVDLTTGETLPAHTDGEICYKGPTMMIGYHNNPKATAETVDEEGWLHSGDVGRYDEEGFIKIVDRTKELIKVKGLQVSPSELEDIIRQHPGVLDVGVLGIPDDRLGEAPRAYVVAKDGVTEDSINEFLDPRISRHKKLVGGIKFLDSLPKSPTGKLLRKELKKLVS